MPTKNELLKRLNEILQSEDLQAGIRELIGELELVPDNTDSLTKANKGKKGK